MKAARLRVVALVVLLAILATGLAGVVAVRGLGRWLVVSEPLEPSPVVVVLGGEVPFRALEAAALVKEGWASQVWLTRPALPPSADATLTRLGIRIVPDDTYNRQILERLGVAPEAIRVLPEPASNTASEVRIVASALRRDGIEHAILVTSRPHTRRVRATWRSVVGDRPRVIVRPPRDDSYDADRWWRTTSDALAVSREVFGLMNVWAGLPVRPEGE